MRIAIGLLGLALLGCQASSSPPTLAYVPESVPIRTTGTAEVIPAAPPQPLAHLNPRRQRLQVGQAPFRPQPKKATVQTKQPKKISIHPSLAVQPRLPSQTWPPSASLQRVKESQARIDSFMAQEQERLKQNQEMLSSRPQPGEGLTPEMQRIAYPQAGMVIP